MLSVFKFHLTRILFSEDFHLRIDKLEKNFLQKINNLTDILKFNGFVLLKSENKLNISNSELFSKSGKDLQIQNAGNNYPTNMISDSIKGSKHTFYWNIQNIHELLTKFNTYKSSPKFFILGL